MSPTSSSFRTCLRIMLVLTVAMSLATAPTIDGKHSAAQSSADSQADAQGSPPQATANLTNSIFLPLVQHNSVIAEEDSPPSNLPEGTAPSQQPPDNYFEQSQLGQDIQAALEKLDRRQIYASALPNGVSFGQSGLAGAALTDPTSLDFGPDNRLYVSQQNGLIYAYTIARSGFSDYAVTATEVINIIQQDTPNYNDDGVRNFTQSRQVTGIMAAGTAGTPVLYVTSSDWRISVGSDSGLDTNSGVLTRLTWTGSTWDRVDLVRGLPRSEENHSTNGMDLDEATNTLYVMSGGNANKGAPGNLLSGTPEYYLAAALLSVDLNALNAMPVYTDSRTGTPFVYDLPTLDDPTRSNINNSSSNFPYPSNHPLYNSSIDPGDPFGGNNGLNQAIPEPGGPVQIYSPGYRNAYDVVLTENGRLYTSDNGPNTGWGGLPLIYAANGSPKGIGPYNPGAGDYCTNEFNETGSDGAGDPLHFISGLGYYGGHPAPIRAFPVLSGIQNYVNNGGGWQQSGPTYDFSALLPPGLSIGNFPNQPTQCIHSTTSGVIDVINASTNGLTEYTASNFGGALKGSILTASFDGSVYYYKMNAAGNAYTNKETIFSGFGSIPLDVTAQGDADVFPGTVWAATYGSNNITVFEPQATSGCGAVYDVNLDEDNDGYSNADEIDAGTDPCSGGSVPTDFDGDFVSDVTDTDDDQDGVLDVVDAFALDANNGLSTNIPLNYSFFNNDPGTGLFGLGFTGLMANGTNDWLDLYDSNLLAAGGTAGLMTVEAVSEGDAYLNLNGQENGFQFGINVDSATAPFSVQTRLLPPYFGVGGNPGTPINYQSMGMYIGSGDQDNYLKVVFNANSGSGGIEVLLEDGGVVTGGATYGPSVVGQILSASTVDIFLLINPQSNTAQPQVALNGGTAVDLGNPVPLPSSWLSGGDNQGLAVGIISTSTQSGLAFGATWDFFNIDFATTTGNNPPVITSPGNQTSENGATISLAIEASDPDDDTLTFSASGLPPGLSINPNTGVIAGTIPADSDGTYGVTVSANDGELTANASFAWIVGTPTGGGDTVRINSGGSAVTIGGVEWLADTYFTGGFTYFSPDPIAGTTADALYQSERFGNLNYAIPVSSNGCYQVTLHFAEIYWQQAGQRLFNVGLEGNTVLSGYDIFAQGGHDVAATESFAVNVTDSLVNLVFTTTVDNAKISAIEVLPSTACGGGGNNPPSITAPSNQSSLEGDVISLIVAASDPDNDTLGFSATGLPSGLIMVEGTGEIAGTLPAGSAGTYNVTATVSDGSLTDSASFTWTVSEPAGNNPPTITSPGNQGSLEGDTISLAVAANDPDGDTLTFSASGLPTGLTIAPATGLIAGTLPAGSAGTYNVTATVSDGALTDSASFTWTVSEPAGNNPPTITSPGNQSSLEGEAVSLTIAANDPDGDTLTFSASGLPTGLTVNPNTGVIAGTVATGAAGTYNATVTVSDGTLTDSASFTWVVTTTTGGGDTIRINAGGPAVTAGGVEWDADTYFSGGFNYFVTTDPIANTQADVIYQTERYGNYSYAIPVANGCYEVRLHAAEIYWFSAGQRLFDVTVEGTAVLTNYDPFVAAGGHDVAIIESFLTTVSDGQVNIEVATQVDNGKLSAVEVLEGTGCP